jgi:hypothetical protein
MHQNLIGPFFIMMVFTLKCEGVEIDKWSVNTIQRMRNRQQDPQQRPIIKVGVRK